MRPQEEPAADSCRPLSEPRRSSACEISPRPTSSVKSRSVRFRGVTLDVERGEFGRHRTVPIRKSTFMHILVPDRPSSGQYILDGADRYYGHATIWLVSATRRSASSSRASTSCRARARSTTSSCRSIQRRQRLKAECTDARAPPSPCRPWRPCRPLPQPAVRRSAAAWRSHRALINELSIILADEPTGNLDSRTSIEVMEIFQRLNAERGITVLLITHEPDIAERHAAHRLRDGRIVRDQPWQGAESPPTSSRRCRLQTMTTPDRQWARRGPAQGVR